MLTHLLLQNFPQQSPTEWVHQNHMKGNFRRQEPNFAVIQDEENTRMPLKGQVHLYFSPPIPCLLTES